MNKRQKKIYNEIISQYNYNEFQLSRIRADLEEGIDVSIYAKPEFDKSQMFEIYSGLRKGLNATIYAKSEFD